MATDLPKPIYYPLPHPGPRVRPQTTTKQHADARDGRMMVHAAVVYTHNGHILNGHGLGAGGVNGLWGGAVG